MLMIELQRDEEDTVQADKATIGSLVTKIYCSLRDGSGIVPVMECLREALAQGDLGEEARVMAKL